MKLGNGCTTFGWQQQRQLLATRATRQLPGVPRCGTTRSRYKLPGLSPARQSRRPGKLVDPDNFPQSEPCRPWRRQCRRSSRRPALRRPQWPQSSRRETASVMVPVSSTLLFEGRAQCARAGWGGWLPVRSCDVVCDGLAAGSGHCGRLDPFGTRIGSPQPGGVRLNETGGASIWMSPKGVCHGATTFLHYFSITTVLGNRRSIPSPIRVVAASFTFGLRADGPRVSALCNWRETALVRG
jgi:hypothetical protein